MKLSVIFITIICALGLNGRAQIATEKELLNYVDEFLSLKGVSQKKIYNAGNESFGTNNTFFLIQFKESGFIIMNKLKALPPILAYSFSSKFDINNMPPAALMYMQRYANETEFYLKETPKNQENHSLWNLNLLKQKSSQVEPLIKTKWNQDIYYNGACPEDNAGPGGRVYAGCVPTAMGQLMNYYRYPETGTGSFSYNDEIYGLLEADFGNTIYRWDEMPMELTEENPAVAELLYHLGVSVSLLYGPGGSGMYNHSADYSLRTYFGYDAETNYYFRDSVAEDFAWTDSLISSLNNKMPMYYAGWGDTIFHSGHAFVCDGYQDSTHFHFNWGWGGYADGYFFIDELTPGSSDFTLLHEVILNMIPGNNYPTHCVGDKTYSFLYGQIEDGSGPHHDYQNNANCSWLLAPEDTVSSINLEFLKFNLEANDFLYIYGGGSTSAPLLETLTGGAIPGNIEFEGDSLLLVFESNSENAAPGFLINYTCTRPDFCSSFDLVNDESGIITDGSGAYQYQNETDCRWSITPDNAVRFRLDFEEFELGEGDRLQIIGGQQNINLYKDSVPNIINIDANSLYLNFSSDFEDRAQGFTINYDSYTESVEDISEKKFNLYPNPTKRNIFIETSIVFDEYQILSVTGKVIESKNLVNQKMDVSHLSTGIYFLKLISDTNVATQQFIIQR